MKALRMLAAIPVIAALGCVTDDAAGPRHIEAAATAALGGDFEYVVNPPTVRVTSGTVVPDGLPFCGSGLVCYPPRFVRSAYNFPAATGAGQTILIVDAFGSPTIRSDLANFDAAFGIPAPPSFTILCPDDGCPTFDPSDTHHNETGWTVETSLDVEYAHAMAPGANIVLVVASTSSGNAINAAEAAAIQRYPGSIMSQSFGIPEILVHGDNAQIQQAHKNYVAAQAAGISVLASAGDLGATNGFGAANASFPASDPLVTGVGGTQGNPYLPPFTFSSCAGGPCNTGLALIIGTCKTGSLAGAACAPDGYGGEQVWNEPAFGSAGGGAPSAFFATPGFQSALGLPTRAVPDVSYNAAVNGGVLVFWSAVPAVAGIYIVGGTSAGSPQWAAILALANQAHGRPLGFVNPALYKLGSCAKRYAADFHDITVGNNQLVGTPVGFKAGTGWDQATGLGTPNVTNLVADLASPPTCS